MTGRAGRARLQAMVALLAALAATGAVGQPAPPAAPPAAAADVMAVLETVEARVAAAALGALATRDSSGFDAIESDLARLPERPATLAHWRAYWRGYAGYEGSIAALRAGDMATARRRLAGAIAALRQIRTPDVESDTLLAAVRGLELAFLPPDRMATAIERVDGLIARIAKAPPTVRSLLVRAQADWNTPAAYGGRRAADALLAQALALPEGPRTGIAPAWGRDMACALRVTVLSASGRDADAQALLAATRTRYPQSAAVRALDRG